MRAMQVTIHAHRVQRVKTMANTCWPSLTRIKMHSVVQGKNPLGNYFTLSLDKSLYDRDAIIKAGYPLTDDYFIHITKAASDSLVIYFYDKNQSASDSSIRNAVQQFLHALHENQMRQITLNETQKMHEDIIHKAFFPIMSLVKKNDTVTEISNSSV